MCKYCKRLKELKALDKKEYEETISRWKSRDAKARNLILHLMCEIEEPSVGYDNYVNGLITKARDFLDESFV